jgi:hypothetical protein
VTVLDLRDSLAGSAPARAWLLACLRAIGRRQTPPRPPADVDWDAAIAAAAAEDLVPAVAHALAARQWPGVPDGARDRLTQGLSASRARHLVMTAELGRVLRRCRAERLEVIVLKGPALAETVYPDPGLRPFSDLDLLVRPADRLRMDAVLRDLGHRRVADEHSWDFDIAFDGATVYEAPAGVRVDLHWSLLTEPRFACNRGELQAVWERSAPITVAGEPALGLGREDLVLHLATHLAVHHTLAGWLRHWDLALVLERAGGDLDWDALLARAARWRVRHALFFVLLGVRSAFGTPVPASALAALRPAGPRAALLAALVRAVDARRLERLEYLVTLLLVDRGRDVCGALRQALWPPADWMRARYRLAAGSRSALYLTHARRLGGVLVQLLGGPEMAPKPPNLGAPPQSRGAPRHYARGPDMAPQPPSARENTRCC